MLVVISVAIAAALVFLFWAFVVLAVVSVVALIVDSIIRRSQDKHGS